MKLNYTILPLAFALMSPLGAQTTYDYTWAGTAESDFLWNTESNWSPSGTPSATSSVYILSSSDNKLSGNNINLGGNVSVKDIVWESSVNTQKLYSGGTLTAENFTTGITVTSWVQYNFSSGLNVTKADGTGVLTLSATATKFDYTSVEYLFNARISADNIILSEFNGWSGGLKLAIGWSGGGSEINPLVKSKNEFRIGKGSIFNSANAITYAEFGGITGSGNITTNNGDVVKDLNAKLTGASTYTYDGTVTGSMNLTVASSGVQKLTSATSAITSVTMQSGELQTAATVGDLSLAGGKISSIANTMSGDILTATSFGWTDGKLALDLDADGSDKVAVSGNFFTSGTSALTFTLTFDDIVMDELLEAAENHSLTYEVITFTGTSSLDNKNFVFEDGYDKYFYDFNANGNSGYLTISSNPIPEPATVAALLGAVTLAFAAWRRRK